MLCYAMRCYAAAGITVIVSSRPCQAWDQEIIKSQNLDPLSYDYLVLKSAVHFRGDFSGIASHIVEVTGPVSVRRRIQRRQDYCPPSPSPLLSAPTPSSVVLEFCCGLSRACLGNRSSCFIYIVIHGSLGTLRSNISNCCVWFGLDVRNDVHNVHDSGYSFEPSL